MHYIQWEGEIKTRAKVCILNRMKVDYSDIICREIVQKNAFN